jgi:hypothetical protein
MEEYIGTATMTYPLGPTGVHVYLQRECKEAINHKQIVFNINKLKISTPTIDSRKTYTIGKSGFSFAHKKIPNEEFVGKYKMYKVEEYFKLKKIEEKL